MLGALLVNLSSQRFLHYLVVQTKTHEVSCRPREEEIEGNTKTQKVMNAMNIVFLPDINTDSFTRA
jgi:hypothetical protein